MGVSWQTNLLWDEKSVYVFLCLRVKVNGKKQSDHMTLLSSLNFVVVKKVKTIILDCINAA